MSRELRALERSTTGSGADRAAMRRLWAVFWGEAEPYLRLRIAATVAFRPDSHRDSG